MDTLEETPPTTYYTPRQVARLLRVKDSTIRKWMKIGILTAEAIQDGKRHHYRIAQQAVDAIAYDTRGAHDKLI